MTKNQVSLAIIFVVSTWTGSTVLSHAEGACLIDESKKRAINDVLCGQMAPEPQYHFTGPNCLANSVHKRFEDTAMQILGYRICGDPQFSDRLKEANLQSVNLFKLLSVCTSERPDFAKIMEDALTETTQRLGRLTCPPELRAVTESRRAYFEKMIALANDPKTIAAILEKVGVTVDASGNVRDK